MAGWSSAWLREPTASRVSPSHIMTRAERSLDVHVLTRYCFALIYG